MPNEIDHVAIPWEVVVEDGAFKVQPEKSAVLALPSGQALLNIGAARPFAAFAFTNPQAKELAERMVALHNASLGK